MNYSVCAEYNLTNSNAGEKNIQANYTQSSSLGPKSRGVTLCLAYQVDEALHQQPTKLVLSPFRLQVAMLI